MSHFKHLELISQEGDPVRFLEEEQQLYILHILLLRDCLLQIDAVSDSL